MEQDTFTIIAAAIEKSRAMGGNEEHAAACVRAALREAGFKIVRAR